MSVTKTLTIAFGLLVAVGSTASAQVAVPINNWSYQRHASTAAEGYLRGSASVITAVGQKNYLDSVAAVNYQEALRRSIENSGLRVKTYFENKEINRAYREKYRELPPTKDQWARIIEASLPDKLTDEQVDPTTGKLIWPHILRTNEYAAFRNRIDQLWNSRTPDNSGDGSPFQIELNELVDGMKLLLKSNVKTLSSTQYTGARFFLLSVEYEALMPMAQPATPSPSQPIAQSKASATPVAAEAEKNFQPKTAPVAEVKPELAEEPAAKTEGTKVEKNESTKGDS